MNEIGKRIRDIRKKKGLSQEELAESAKVNLRTIQRIENRFGTEVSKLYRAYF